MTSAFGTIFKFDKEENFDEFVASLNLSQEEKAGFKKAPTGETLLKNGDGSFTHVDYFPEKDLKTTFTPCVELEVPFSNRSIKTVFNFEDKALVQKVTVSDGDVIIIKRKANDDGTILTATFSSSNSNVVGTRYFKK